MSGHGEKLTRKQEAAVAALLSEATHAKAAEKAGVSASTLGRWLRVPEFLAAYREARRRIVEDAITRLQRLTARAAGALARSLKAAKSADQIRAAKAVLDFALKGLEVADLVQAVEDLQAQLEEMRHGHGAAAAGGGEAEGGSGPQDRGDVPSVGGVAGGPVPDFDRGGDDAGPVAGDDPASAFASDDVPLQPAGGEIADGRRAGAA
jgi:hypothetical protein